jgi:CubicO group peptidase (beta-lactamase class C family)
MNVAILTLLSLASSFQAVVDRANSEGGLAGLVMQDGKIVAEGYANGGAADRATELASGTKSFTGVMAMCAVQDGLMTLDEPMSATITEWKADPRRSKITVRQLLTLTSGIDGGPLAIGNRVPTYKQAIEAPAVADPGTRFDYGPTPYQIFGEFLRRKLKQESVGQYMDRRVLKPIGVKCDFWRRDADGNIHLPSGAHLTAREWAKFGEMVRLGGKRVVRQDLLDTCFSGTSVRPGYGLTWWLPGAGPVGANPRLSRNLTRGLPKDVWMAAGAGGQRLVVIRSLGVVAVRLAPLRGVEAGFSEKAWLDGLVAAAKR